MTSTALKYLKWGFALLFLHITVGRIDLLPDFVGVLFIWLAFRSQDMTETERRMGPLLLIMAADYFFHWLFDFSNGLENIIMTIISDYVIFILLGEVAKRIKENQPNLAKLLEYERIAITVVLVFTYLFGSYNLVTVGMLLSIAMVVMLVILLWVLFRIEPVEDNTSNPIAI